MSHRADLNSRTRLLLMAHSSGAGISIYPEDDPQMRDLIAEGLFAAGNSPFKVDYWPTEKGRAAAEQVYEATPVHRIETRYRDHPNVHLDENGWREETLHVGTVPINGWMTGSTWVWVRESLGDWLADDPNGDGMDPPRRFDTVDAAIEFVLTSMNLPLTPSA
jgi:hypothetical protein